MNFLFSNVFREFSLVKLKSRNPCEVSNNVLCHAMTRFSRAINFPKIHRVNYSTDVQITRSCKKFEKSREKKATLCENSAKQNSLVCQPKPKDHCW